MGKEHLGCVGAVRDRKIRVASPPFSVPTTILVVKQSRAAQQEGRGRRGLILKFSGRGRKRRGLKRLSEPESQTAVPSQTI
jgi:hypothetical protein